MDEVHEINTAEKMAKDMADILERLAAIERKLDSLCNSRGNDRTNAGQ